MDIGLIERVYDKEKIHGIVKTMFDDIVEDNTEYSCFDLDTKRDCWLSCDNYKGLFHIKAFNRTALDIHCYIPKENRSDSFKYGRLALLWVKESAPSMYKKVVTQCPSMYRHIALYLMRLGFSKEGCYKSAFTKEGRLWDLNIFGLDRCDI